MTAINSVITIRIASEEDFVKSKLLNTLCESLNITAPTTPNTIFSMQESRVAKNKGNLKYSFDGYSLSFSLTVAL